MCIVNLCCDLCTVFMLLLKTVSVCMVLGKASVLYVYRNSRLCVLPSYRQLGSETFTKCGNLPPNFL